MKPRIKLTLWILGLVLNAPYQLARAEDTSRSSYRASESLNKQVDALLKRAQWWEAKNRLELAQESLDKLFSISPNNPSGLAALAQFEIKHNNLKKAQASLAKLRQVQPIHPEIHKIEALLRAKGDGRSELRHARALAKEGGILWDQAGHLRRQDKETEANARIKQKEQRYTKAVSIFHKLFPRGAPSDDLALEYWSWVSSTPNGWRLAHTGLSRLLNRHPNNLRYQLALAELETSRLPLKQDALLTLINMSKVPAYSKQARQAWRSTMLQLENAAPSLPLLGEYIKAEPGDSAVREKRNEIILALELERKLKNDPNYRAKQNGLALLQKGELDKAEPLLQQALRARPKDIELVGGMGMLRLRQGQHTEAKQYFITAARLSGQNSEKWNALIKVAQFWQLMREARDARKTGNFKQTENSLNLALQLQANNPDALVLLADMQVDRNMFAKAEANYQRVLATDDVNRAALEGLTELYQKQIKLLSQDEVKVLLNNADSLLAVGNDNEAITSLKQAIKLEANNPWLRLTLAKLYAKQNHPEQGQALFDNLLAKQPDDVQTLYALALFQSSIAPQQALDTLALIPVAQRTAKIMRLWSQNIEQLTNTQVQSGHQDKAKHILHDAEKLTANNEEGSLAIAIVWGKIGEYHEAERIFNKLRGDPPSRRWLTHHAEYLVMQGSPLASEALDALAALPSSSADETQKLYSMQESNALHTANAQIEAGKPSTARQILSPFLKKSPKNISILLALARTFRAERRWTPAQSVYARILRLQGDEIDARRGLIETKIAGKKRVAALEQVGTWAADHSDTSLDIRLQLFDFYLLLNETQHAHQQLDRLLAQHPRNARVHDKAWQLAQRENHPDEMIIHLQQALAADHSASTIPTQSTLTATDNSEAWKRVGFDELGSPKKIHRDWKEKKLAALLDRRSTWLSSAIDIRSRNGTPGVSQYNASEIPLEYKIPWHANDEVFFRTDIVQLNSGTLEASNTSFGSMKLCQPNCTTGPLAQTARGMSFTAGYQGVFSADIGITPLGFAVTNVVGGIRFDEELGPLSVSLQASRRPITSSLLSFAGTVDPNTGRKWGGVVATGGQLGLSLDKGERFGLWATLGQHRLSGNNVLNNDRTQLMSGVQWRIINEENRLLSLGLSGMYWHNSQNSGEYTFGHGGYYSPQSYRSLSLPIVFGERYPRFSYVLRASVSSSQSQTQTADYYPTNTALQIADPRTYSGGPGGGSGYSGMAACEYQASQKLFVGGLLNVERSDYYAPNRILFYLRYSLDRPAAQPVHFQPLAVEPSSQF